jgi:1-acyl-sn-glycerol-3-phosphate acyltransferase
MDGPYRAVRAVARFWVWFFFRSLRARGLERVPGAGPVLLAINHPNNLIDSLVVGALLPRKVHFLATASLFHDPWLARFLAAMGVIPVYRRQDDPDHTARNTEAFEACFRTLAAGGLIAIYPEGTTHAEPRVQRIRTGAARIALEAEARHDGGLRLTLLPVGLNFDARKSFRTRALVSVGEPIPVTPYLGAYREDPRRAVEALTAMIQHGMESQVIHVARLDLAGLVREIETLYRGDLAAELERERGLGEAQIDPFRLSRAIAGAVHYFAAREPARVERLARRIAAYRARLGAWRIRDAAVRRAAARCARRPVALGARGLLGAPLFLYGALVNGLPYYAPRVLARRLARKETDYATVRLLAGIVAFPLFWAAEIWIVRRLGGPLLALAFALSLPIAGLWASRYLGGLVRLREEVEFGLLALTHRQAAGRLVAERRRILEDLDAAKGAYLAATKGSSW